MSRGVGPTWCEHDDCPAEGEWRIGFDDGGELELCLGHALQVIGSDDRWRTAVRIGSEADRPGRRPFHAVG
jgi:hypothetical protein